MTSSGSESGSTPTPFESEYQLLPLGNDFEARAQRAEAIASAVLAELFDLDSGVLPPSIVRMRGVKRVTQEALDPYRDPKAVEARQAWERADAEQESYDY